jgi:hypothetical protein
VPEFLAVAARCDEHFQWAAVALSGLAKEQMRYDNQKIQRSSKKTASRTSAPAELRKACLETLEDRRLFSVAYSLAGTAGTILNRFDTATPATITDSKPVTGLQTGETLQGIDFRPTTGVLFALGVVNDAGATSSGRLYTINLATGAATQVGTTPFSTALPDGASYGFDFNHTVDRIRVTNDADQNFRLDPTNGALLGPDTDLDNPAGAESVTGVAYDRVDKVVNTPTTLYGIDSGNSTLVTIGGVDGTPSPNGGVVTTVGSLGVALSSTDVAFDIAPDGSALA